MPHEVIRVALVDDQALIRDGFSLILGAAEGVEVCSTFPHGGEFLRAIEMGLAVDVALVDIQMPVVDGIETVERLKAGLSCPKILILTTFDDNYLVQRALRTGADGYLLKRCTGPELVAAVRDVHAGGAALTPSVAQQVLTSWRSQAAPVRASRQPDFFGALTSREAEVFRLIGKGLSNEEIASTLFLSQGTVKKHVTAILAKSGVRDRVNLALAAQGWT